MLKQFIASTVAILLVALSGLTLAQTHSPGQSVRGGTCYGTMQAVQCEYLGKVTIREIYEKGWRVVAFVKEGPNSVSFVIEEQRSSAN